MIHGAWNNFFCETKKYIFQIPGKKKLCLMLAAQSVTIVGAFQQRDRDRP